VAPIEDCPSCEGTGFVCIDCGSPDADCYCETAEVERCDCNTDDEDE
jgi:hypothetical protein